MKEYTGYRILKTAFGAALAIYIASLFNLSYVSSAGIITILSIQSTKKDSLQLAAVRLGSTTLALVIASIVFFLLGYSAVSFGLYLLLFIPLASRFNMSDGIVMSSVLVTHLLIEETIALSWIVNEYGLLIIGAGIALILNIHMPSIENEIKGDQRKVECLMKEILIDLSKVVRGDKAILDEDNLYEDLDKTLKQGYKRAEVLAHNNLTKDYNYYVKYMAMRRNQFESLKYMKNHILRVDKYYKQNNLIAALTELVSFEFDELNTAEELMTDLEMYLEDFRTQDLPKTREEFENRSYLYQYLKDLEHLLWLKKDFADKLTSYEKLTFWDDAEKTKEKK